MLTRSNMPPVSSAPARNSSSSAPQRERSPKREAHPLSEMRECQELAAKYESTLPEWLRTAWAGRRGLVETQQMYADSLLSKLTPHRYNYFKGFDSSTVLSKIIVLRDAFSSQEVSYLEKTVTTEAIRQGFGPSSSNTARKKTTVIFSEDDFNLAGYTFGAGTPSSPTLPTDIVLQSYCERLIWRFRAACAALGCMRQPEESGNQQEEQRGGEGGESQSQSQNSREDGKGEKRGGWTRKGEMESGDWAETVIDWWRKDEKNNSLLSSNNLFSSFSRHHSSAKSPGSQVATMGFKQGSQIAMMGHKQGEEPNKYGEYDLNSLPKPLRNLKVSLEETREEGGKTQELLRSLSADGLYDLASKLEGPREGEFRPGQEQQLSLDRTLLQAISNGEFSFSKIGAGSRRPTVGSTTRRSSFNVYHCNFTFKNNEQAINYHADDETTLYVNTPILGFGPSNRVVTFKCNATTG